MIIALVNCQGSYCRRGGLTNSSAFYCGTSYQHGIKNCCFTCLVRVVNQTTGIAEFPQLCGSLYDLGYTSCTTEARAVARASCIGGHNDSIEGGTVSYYSCICNDGSDLSQFLGDTSNTNSNGTQSNNTNSLKVYFHYFVILFIWSIGFSVIGKQ